MIAIDPTTTSRIGCSTEFEIGVRAGLLGRYSPRRIVDKRPLQEI